MFLRFTTENEILEHFFLAQIIVFSRWNFFYTKGFDDFDGEISGEEAAEDLKSGKEEEAKKELQVKYWHHSRPIIHCCRVNSKINSTSLIL